MVNLDAISPDAMKIAGKCQSLDNVEFYCVVIASMSNLLGYPHGYDEIWSDYISCPPHRVRDVIEEFKAVDL